MQALDVGQGVWGHCRKGTRDTSRAVLSEALSSRLGRSLVDMSLPPLKHGTPKPSRNEQAVYSCVMGAMAVICLLPGWGRLFGGPRPSLVLK